MKLVKLAGLSAALLSSSAFALTIAQQGVGHYVSTAAQKGKTVLATADQNAFMVGNQSYYCVHVDIVPYYTYGVGKIYTVALGNTGTTTGGYQVNWNAPYPLSVSVYAVYVPNGCASGSAGASGYATVADPISRLSSTGYGPGNFVPVGTFSPSTATIKMIKP